MEIYHFFIKILENSILFIKVLKFIYDLALLVLLILLMVEIDSSDSTSCFNDQLKITFVILIFAIMMPICINSMIELFVYLHRFWKKCLTTTICCIQTHDDNDYKTQDDKDFSLCVYLLVSLVGIILGLVYSIFYLFVSLLRLIDIRNCFWKAKINYITFIIYYLIQTVVYSYSIGVMAAIVHSESCAKTNSTYSIVILVMIIFRFVKRTVYFFTFEYFVPSELDEAWKKVEKSQVQVFHVENQSNLSIIDVNSRKNIPFFPKKYLFMPQFLRFARIIELGSVGCLASSSCASTDLEHIFLSHNKFNIPNQNCRCWYDCTSREGYLVGFHQTSRESALCISQSPMRKTQGGWFGDGIYFARNYDHTEFKVGQFGDKGSLIIALIDMKRIKHVRKHIDELNDPNLLTNFDSVYAHKGCTVIDHNNEIRKLNLDEFLIFNENQIIQFLVAIPSRRSEECRKYIELKKKHFKK